MCNLSEVILERGMEKGEVLKLIAQVCRKMQKGKTAEEIAEDLEESKETIEKIYKVALKNQVDENQKEKIYEELNAD